MLRIRLSKEQQVTHFPEINSAERKEEADGRDRKYDNVDYETHCMDSNN